MISYTNENYSLNFMSKKKGGENFVQIQTHNMYWTVYTLFLKSFIYY